ncbi:MAG TPA: DinB family protein [Gemmatimonadaceae bacterium]|jgi:hypothetical protein|nr:DinB family protein [Gemmatimonadaceae bacterium]
MTETMTAKTTIATPLDPTVNLRILEEGFGPGAWHGADLRAALADVSPHVAFWRPGPGRHNIAEIALHHAWCVRSVIGQITGSAEEAFPLEGADWFGTSDEKAIRWADVAALVERQHKRLAAVLDDIGNGTTHSSMSETDRFDLVLGVTCHAVYHAGQVQLIKVLNASEV